MPESGENFGTLYLIPTTLGDNAPLEVLPISIKRIIEKVDLYIAENEKVARRFIKKISSNKAQGGIQFQLLNKFTDPLEMQSYLNPCLDGKDMGLMSDAGCPGVADPGADIVAIAHEKGIKVVPLVGPSSILMAMMASGMNGQSFAFNGYLPIDKHERKNAIRKFEKKSQELNQSQIFIETPYRNDKLFADLKSALSDHTYLCLACDITLATEYIKTLTISNWRKTTLELNKRPCIFIFHKK